MKGNRVYFIYNDQVISSDVLGNFFTFKLFFLLGEVVSNGFFPPASPCCIVALF